MAQSKILIDTNAYLRLAQNIRPLLNDPFGTDDYCLYVIPELNDELSVKRLKDKFPWINHAEYSENRKIFPSLSKKQKKSIKDTYEHVWGFALTEHPGPSRVDCLYVAHAIEMEVSLITDDLDMAAIAQIFEVTVMGALELLHLMLNSGHVDIEKVNSIIAYWRHIGDTPTSPRKLNAEYRKLFRKDPP